mmetsp:Transcript_54185/g.115680  ORF Transcript_54185/g.115680 Transcript_54185/m.115680 type:complete len:190 (+) Transcript_54185:103-672(+)
MADVLPGQEETKPKSVLDSLLAGENSSLQLDALPKNALEELALQLFVTIKRQEVALAGARQAAARRVVPDLANHRPVQSEGSMGRKRNIPKGPGNSPLTSPRGQARNVGRPVHTDPHRMTDEALGLAQGRKVRSEAEAQQIFDGLYNRAKEQRIRRHTYAELQRLSEEVKMSQECPFEPQKRPGRRGFP